jgi:hypothetical protein
MKVYKQYLNEWTLANFPFNRRPICPKGVQSEDNLRRCTPYLYPPGTGWPGYTPRQWAPFSSPPTTRGATVEVFDPASTRDSALIWSHLRVSQSQSYVTTDGQSASLSWNKAPIWGLWPDFYSCQTVAGFLMWGTLSHERAGLSFTFAAGTRQHSHFRIRVPWDSRPYFTVSGSRVPFSSPPTTRRATVEVFDPASTRDSPPPKSMIWSSLGFLLYHVGTDRQSKHLSISYPRKRRFVTQRIPRIYLRGNTCLSLIPDIHGNVFPDSFPSNGSARHNILDETNTRKYGKPRPVEVLFLLILQTSLQNLFL